MTDKFETERKLEVVTAELRTLAEEIATLTEEGRQWRPVLAIGPQQIHDVGKTPEGADLVTVTYPVGATTVLSIQPDGSVQTRLAGACGPYELALLQPDRLVYAPLGPAGAVFVIPYSDVIPNE